MLQERYDQHRWFISTGFVHVVKVENRGAAWAPGRKPLSVAEAGRDQTTDESTQAEHRRKVSGREDGVGVMQPDPAFPEKGTPICGGTPHSGPLANHSSSDVHGKCGAHLWYHSLALLCHWYFPERLDPKKEELKMVFKPCPWFLWAQWIHASYGHIHQPLKSAQQPSLLVTSLSLPLILSSFIVLPTACLCRYPSPSSSSECRESTHVFHSSISHGLPCVLTPRVFSPPSPPPLDWLFGRCSPTASAVKLLFSHIPWLQYHQRFCCDWHGMGLGG